MLVCVEASHGAVSEPAATVKHYLGLFFRCSSYFLLPNSVKMETQSINLEDFTVVTVDGKAVQQDPGFVLLQHKTSEFSDALLGLF